MSLRIQVCVSVLFVIAAVGFRPTRADIYRWDNGELIPGTEGIELRPRLVLLRWNTDGHNLRYADLSGRIDLQNAHFETSWLDYARLTEADLTSAFLYQCSLSRADLTRVRLVDAFVYDSTLTAANLTGADLTNADLDGSTLSGAILTGANLTNANLPLSIINGANLTEANLTDANLHQSTLSGANLAEANLTNANLRQSTLTGVDFTGAMVMGTSFSDAAGFTKEQLYSTASYQASDLRSIQFRDSDLAGWNFSGQNLTNADFGGATLADARLTGALVRGVSFSETIGFTKEQLYSTASYQASDLRGIRFSGNDLTGWNFGGQKLTKADFGGSALTDARLTSANLIGAYLGGSLTNADLTGAIVNGASIHHFAASDITEEQLYSTASYQNKNLQGVSFAGNLEGWDFSGQNLTNAGFALGSLRNANFADAIIQGLYLDGFHNVHLSREQLYSTRSYQDGDLRGLHELDASFRDMDLSGKNLANGSLIYADFNNTNLTRANLTNVNLRGSHLTNSDLSGASLVNTNLADAELASTVFDSETTYSEWTVFPWDFDPDAAGLTLVVPPEGDYDASGHLDAADIDMVATIERDSDWLRRLEWLGGLFDDHRSWVKTLAYTWFGDANLDGYFSSGDLVQVFAAGKYEQEAIVNQNGEILNPVSWSEGDWNGDGVFNSDDMVTAFVDGGYEQGPREDAAAVPEPAVWMFAFLSGLTLLHHRRPRQNEWDFYWRGL